MWGVNFTDRRTWFVNSWSSVRRDWPLEIYVTREFHLSFRGNLMFFQKPCTQEERFEVFPLYTWSVNFSKIDVWNSIRTPSVCYHPKTTLSLNLQSRRNFGERVLSIFVTKIMAAIFDFNGSGRLGRERNMYHWGSRRSKIGRGVGWGKY